MLTDVNAWCSRGDGPKLAANLVGRVRLGIEAIVLAQSARKEHVDDCLRRRATLSGGRAQPQHVRHGQAEQANRPGLEHRAACEPRVLQRTRTHGMPPRHGLSVAIGFYHNTHRLTWQRKVARNWITRAGYASAVAITCNCTKLRFCSFSRYSRPFLTLTWSHGSTSSTARARCE